MRERNEQKRFSSRKQTFLRNCSHRHRRSSRNDLITCPITFKTLCGPYKLFPDVCLTRRHKKKLAELTFLPEKKPFFQKLVFSTTY